MIRQKYNLRCTKGHYHYSPTPTLYIGRRCEKPLGDRVILKDGSLGRTSKKCDAVLARFKRR